MLRKAKLTFTAIAIGAILTIAFANENSQVSSRSNSSQTAHGSSTQTETHALLIQSAANDAEQTSKEIGHGEEQVPTDWWTRVTGLLTVGLIALQAYIYSRQGQLMEEQAKIMQATLRSTNSVERPYIRVTDIISRVPAWQASTNPKNEWVVLEYYFENYGKTPAIFTEYAHGLYIGREVPTHFGAKPRPIFHQSIVEAKSRSTQEVLTLNHYTVGSPQHVDVSEMEKLRRKEIFLYFFGYAEYEDVFGYSHRADFCWYWDAEHDAFTPVRNKSLNRTT